MRKKNRTNVKSHNMTNFNVTMNYTYAVRHERVLEANTMYHEILYFFCIFFNESDFMFSFLIVQKPQFNRNAAQTPD